MLLAGKSVARVLKVIGYFILVLVAGLLSEAPLFEFFFLLVNDTLLGQHRVSRAELGFSRYN